MAQPKKDDQDNSLRIADVTEKRGRGRPRKPDALTNAQRQAAFRARRKAAGKAVTVTKKDYDEIVLEHERLREALAQARRALAEASHHPARDGAPHAALDALVHPVPADQGDLDDRQLALTVNSREFFSLERLAAHCGLSKRAVLERLLWWADRSVVLSFGEDDVAFNRYVDSVTKKAKIKPQPRKKPMPRG
jgi:hypothetical protein